MKNIPRPPFLCIIHPGVTLKSPTKAHCRALTPHTQKGTGQKRMFATSTNALSSATERAHPIQGNKVDERFRNVHHDPPARPLHFSSLRGSPNWLVFFRGTGNRGGRFLGPYTPYTPSSSTRTGRRSNVECGRECSVGRGCTSSGEAIVPSHGIVSSQLDPDILDINGAGGSMRHWPARLVAIMGVSLERNACRDRLFPSFRDILDASVFDLTENQECEIKIPARKAGGRPS